jgi:hypothetical protein
MKSYLQEVVRRFTADRTLIETGFNRISCSQLLNPDLNSTHYQDCKRCTNSTAIKLTDGQEEHEGFQNLC